MNNKSYFCYLFVLFGFAIFSLCVPYSYSTNFEKNIINLSNNEGNSSDAYISANQNNVYAVWTDDELGNNEIFFKRSTDAGNTFGSTENLSVTNGSSIFPQISVSENYVYVFWTDYTTGNGDVYVRTSSDGGNTFSPIKNISNKLNGTDIGISSYAIKNRIFVVWTDKVPLNEVIRLKSSLDGGQNFNNSKIVSKKGVAETSDKIKDNGLNFSGFGSSSSDLDNFGDVTITSDGENLFVIWIDNIQSTDSTVQWDLRYRMITNKGENLTIPKTLTKNIGDFADSPQIVSVNNTIYVTWVDRFGKFNQNNNEIFIITSNNYGESFNDPVNLSANLGNSIEPKMSSGNGYIFVIWTDYTEGNGEIYLKILPK
ncbi:MAG: hypothetical protein DA328_05230 [Nitrososphaeraceae archaeon]|nr:hypothetical protein [Nitrososphaeraceae archaeon]